MPKTKDKSKVYLVDSGESDTVNLKDKKYRKQILRYGKWFHDNATDGVLEVTKDKAKELVDNFKEKVIENVPVLRGHATQEQVDKDPDLVAADTLDLELEEDGVYAVIKTADDKADEQIETKYKNVSASIDEDYVDHETGKSKGWTLRHIALTQEPYIKKLDPNFVALSDEYDKEIVKINLSDKNMKKKKVELEEEKKLEEEKEGAKEKKGDKTEEKKEVKKEKGDKKEEVKVKKKKEVEKDKEEDVTGSEKDPIKKASEESKSQAESTDMSESGKKLQDAEKRIAELELSEAKGKIGQYVKEGKILPKQKEVALSLLTSKTTVNLAEGQSESVSELFETFIKESTAQVDMSEKGVQPKTKEDSDEDEVSWTGLSKKELKRAQNLYK